MKTDRSSLIAAAGFLVILILIATGAKTFRLNGQAWDMWVGFGNDPITALLSGHPHGLRYLAYFPMFWVASLLHVPPDLVFSVVCAGLLLLMAVCIKRVSFDIWGGVDRLQDAVTVAIFAMALFMNGRLILAFSGYLLVIFVGVRWLKYRKWKPAYVAYLVVALILSGVSSGTLVVAMALVVGIGAVTLLRAPALFMTTPQMVVSLGVVLLLFAAPTVIGINKNLAFYGGDDEAAIRMLNHGAARDIVNSLGGELPTLPAAEDDVSPTGSLGDILQYWWVAVLTAGFIGRMMGWRPIRMVRESEPHENIVHSSLVLTILGGLFGYSVLSMSIVPCLILASGYTLPIVGAVLGRSAQKSNGSGEWN